MTYAKDRTLLASLSFGDKDKNDPRHDLVSKYLAQPEVAQKILELFSVRKEKNSTTDWKYDDYERAVVRHIYTYADSLSIKVAAEVPLTKGQGQYKTFIGFIDGFIRLFWEGTRRTEIKQSKKWPGPSQEVKLEEIKIKEEPNYDTAVNMPFEVKIHPESVGNVLRQIKLYDEFRTEGGSTWLLVTAYDVSPAEQEVFKENNIVCVRLGAAFDEFVRAQQSRDQQNSTLRSAII